MKQRPRRVAAPRRGEEGVALILALLCVVLLSAIVVEYAYETQVEASLTTNSQDDFEAYVAAKSGVAAGMGMLEGDLVESAASVGSQPLNQETLDQLKEGQLPSGAEADTMLDMWAQGVPHQKMNNAILQCHIADEYGKINLNALVTTNQEGQPQVNEPLAEALRVLFSLCEVEEDPTDRIIDWLDPDDDAGPNGAESDVYSGIEPPLACKNGPMDSLEELLLIPGITPELYFDLNRDPAEREQLLEGEKWMTLPDVLTVHGAPDGRININTAPRLVLESIFTALQQAGVNVGITPDEILAAQFEAPYQDRTQLRQILFTQAGSGQSGSSQQGQNTPYANLFDVKSDVFRIWGHGICNEAMVRIEAYVARVPLEGLGQQGTDGQMLEPMRILEWRVYR
jgi:type II secretory pathway component PulK